LKLIDFGLSSELVGKHGTSKLYTQTGTPGYQAPEILRRLGYDGVEVDLFASAVCLFMMVAATPPFGGAGEAKSTNAFYRHFYMNEPSKFW